MWPGTAGAQATRAALALFFVGSLLCIVVDAAAYPPGSTVTVLDAFNDSSVNALTGATGVAETATLASFRGAALGDGVWWFAMLRQNRAVRNVGLVDPVLAAAVGGGGVLGVSCSGVRSAVGSGAWAVASEGGAGAAQLAYVLKEPLDILNEYTVTHVVLQGASTAGSAGRVRLLALLGDNKGYKVRSAVVELAPGQTVSELALGPPWTPLDTTLAPGSQMEFAAVRQVVVVAVAPDAAGAVFRSSGALLITPYELLFPATRAVAVSLTVLFVCLGVLAFVLIIIYIWWHRVKRPEELKRLLDDAEGPPPLPPRGDGAVGVFYDDGGLAADESVATLSDVGADMLEGFHEPRF